MTDAALIAKIDKIRYSSAWASGDRTTFKMPVLPGIDLPGADDPVAYAARALQCAKYTPPEKARIAIFGAGLGGLGAHFLNMGASQVVLIEPRFRYHTALDLIVPVLDEIHAPEHTDTVKAFKAWPQVGHIQSLGQFNLVIAPEGFEESADPVETLAALLAMTMVGGRLVIEVTHGEAKTAPAGKVNSWRPTQEAFEALLTQMNAEAKWTVGTGRGDNRRIYGIEVAPAGPVKPVVKDKPFSEPMPKPIAKKVEPSKVEEPTAQAHKKPEPVWPSDHGKSKPLVHVGPPAEVKPLGTAPVPAPAPEPLVEIAAVAKKLDEKAESAMEKGDLGGALDALTAKSDLMIAAGLTPAPVESPAESTPVLPSPHITAEVESPLPDDMTEDTTVVILPDKSEAEQPQSESDGKSGGSSNQGRKRRRG